MLNPSSPRIDSPYPLCVLLAEEALQAIYVYTTEAYYRSPTEWGGLLWGQLFQHPQCGVVPVVVWATNGVCDASPTRCDIKSPDSWESGRRELAGRGLASLDLLCLGDYHSHPGFHAFFSSIDDLSFWSYGDIPHWCSMVVDPWHHEHGIWVKNGPQSRCRVRHFRVSRRVLAALGLVVPSPPERAIPARQ